MGYSILGEFSHFECVLDIILYFCLEGIIFSFQNTLFINVFCLDESYNRMDESIQLSSFTGEIK